ncbi:hypothetical protein A3768_3079 [Ralstonia solanacearum]|nr:hypothetical protein A3768_3079 [Ralstonia solanacearum]
MGAGGFSGLRQRCGGEGEEGRAGNGTARQAEQTGQADDSGHERGWGTRRKAQACAECGRPHVNAAIPGASRQAAPPCVPNSRCSARGGDRVTPG